jgi:uncharacterized protein DUF5666
MLRIRFVVLLLSVTACVASAQQGPPPEAAPQTPPGVQQGGPGQRNRMFAGQGTGGNITAISGETITLKTINGTETVKTNADTMFRKDRQPAKLADFKVGDTVFVAGDKSGETWTARIVASRSGPGMMNPEDLGKKFIIGEVKKIEGTKITVKRPDGVEQAIEVDEDTSFRNSRRESVTLADVKVGDRVGGRGALKDGTFVAAVLTVGLPDRMMMPGPSDEQGPAATERPKQDKKQ